MPDIKAETDAAGVCLAGSAARATGPASEAPNERCTVAATAGDIVSAAVGAPSGIRASSVWPAIGVRDDDTEVGAIVVGP